MISRSLFIGFNLKHKILELTHLLGLPGHHSRRLLAAFQFAPILVQLIWGVKAEIWAEEPSDRNHCRELKGNYLQARSSDLGSVRRRRTAEGLSRGLLEAFSCLRILLRFGFSFWLLVQRRDGFHGVQSDGCVAKVLCDFKCGVVTRKPIDVVI
jgi:hypothetical protein